MDYLGGGNELRNNWVSVRDLGIKYGKETEKIVRKDWESENKVTDLNCTYTTGNEKCTI